MPRWRRLCWSWTAARGRRIDGCLALLLVFGFAGTASAQVPSTDVAELRSELERLRVEYDGRIRDLENRLALLEGGSAPQPEPDELADIRAAARDFAAGAQTSAVPAVEDAPRVGRRSLNQFNPEVSFTGNVLARSSSRTREQFEMQEFELDLQASLDPYSRTRVTLAVEAGGALEIEEAYIAYPALSRGVGLTVGKFRQTFGVLNRQHLHALPQIDYPLVLLAFFGDDGLGQTGLSLEWLLPVSSRTSTHELTLQVTDSENEAFAGDSFDRLAALVHVKNFWELSAATYFEWGFSGISGDSQSGGSNRVWGTDLTFHWQPPSRAKYREITVRAEALLSERHDSAGRRHEALGGYAYVEGLLRRNLSAGVRYDKFEDPLEPQFRLWGISPYLSWWQSEYVRLRAELQHLEGSLLDESEDRFLIQMTWAAGPHKHESY